MVPPLPLSRPVPRHSGKVCASLGMWKGKTSSLSVDTRRENSTACRSLRRSSRLKVDVIVTTAPLPTRAAKEATVTIPIVMMQDRDPVGTGFVASLARPGGNITGLSTLRPEISGKHVEFLKSSEPATSVNSSDGAIAKGKPMDGDSLDEKHLEELIDETLAENFPASNPPSWTLGRERRKPSIGTESLENRHKLKLPRLSQRTNGGG